ncbi:hypothetical protein BH24DEI2_BH24DEI2_28020 [soil metagenome]
MFTQVRNVVLLALVFGLAACSSTGPSPAAPAPQPAPAVINLDNDFWFGTVTSPDSSGVMDIGLGFAQTGDAVLGGLVLPDETGQPAYCCSLEGTVTGNVLELVYQDSVGDQIKVSGTFGADGKTLTGKLIFVIDGQTESFTLELAYESEFTTSSL